MNENGRITVVVKKAIPGQKPKWDQVNRLADLERLTGVKFPLAEPGAGGQEQEARDRRPGAATGGLNRS